jgi:hypothetical protein
VPTAPRRFSAGVKTVRLRDIRPIGTDTSRLAQCGLRARVAGVTGCSSDDEPVTVPQSFETPTSDA